MGGGKGKGGDRGGKGRARRRGGDAGSEGPEARIPVPPPPPPPRAKSSTSANSGLAVSGCRDDVVGPIIRGHFAFHSENHDKPVYKKVEQTRGLEGQVLDVMIYFWDDSDPTFCGWWFGPKVGGDQVWAYHPKHSAPTPPTTGWKVPFDGPEDTTMVLSTASVPRPSPDMPSASGPSPDVAKVTKEGVANGSPWAPPGQEDSPGDKQAQQKQQVPEHRKEDDAKRRKEQPAVLEIRRVIQRVKLAKPENFEALAAELREVLAKSGAAAGGQEAKVRDEAEKAQEQAAQRVGKINAQLAKEVGQKEENERKRQERFDAIWVLINNFRSLVEKAEEGVAALKTVVESHSKVEPTAEEIEAASEEIDEVGVTTKASYQACAEFIASSKSRIEKVPSHLTETRLELADLQKRVENAARMREELKCAAEAHRQWALERVEATRDALERKNRAEGWVARQLERFRKYDKDGDGQLNREEVLEYSKGELAFEISSEAIDKILAAVNMYASDTRDSAEKRALAVPSSAHQRLRVELGIAREVARDLHRAAKAQERRKELEEQRQVLRLGIDAVEVVVKETEEAAAKVEAKARELTELGDNVAASDMARSAREADALLEAAKADVQPVIQRVNDIDIGEEHAQVLKPEREKLQVRLNRLNAQLCRAVVRNAALHKRAANKQKLEAETLHTKITDTLRARLATCERRHEELFKQIDGNHDGVIDQEELVTFLEVHWDGGIFPRDAVVRWFRQVNGEGTVTLEAKDVERLVRRCYKVVHSTVMNDKLDASDSESSAIRRLEVNDVLELYSNGPEEDAATGVMRIRARALASGDVGYVTVKSNQGTVYIETGGNLFIVVKETPLSEAFAGRSNGAACQETRKLKDGEMLEVLEHPRKDEASGSMWAKVKAQSDGAVGWATSVSSQGQVFLKVV